MVVVEAWGEQLPQTITAVERTAEGMPLDVVAVVPGPAAVPGLPSTWRHVEQREHDTVATLPGILATSEADRVAVIEAGSHPSAGCIPELLLALGHAGVGAARVVSSAGTAAEAGVIAWRNGEFERYGERARADDPRWRPTRLVDAFSSGAYAARRDVLARAVGEEGPDALFKFRLCREARRAGLDVICPAGAWVVSADAAASPQPLPHGESALRALFTNGTPALLPRPAGSPWLGSHPGAAARVLVCERAVPRGEHYAGERRVTDVVRILCALGSRVTLLAFHGLRRQPYTDMFEALGVEVFCPTADPVPPMAAWHHVVDGRAGLYDVIYFPWVETYSEHQAAARRAFPRAMVIYDAHDLHHQRLERQLSIAGGVTRAQVEAVRQREVAAFRSADIVLTISPDQSAVIAELAPGARIVPVPLVHETVEEALVEGRRDMLFVGGFSHPPNVDAVLWFVERVLPLIRRHSSARMVLVGAEAGPKILALESESVVIAGHVADANSMYDRARVFVSPLRFGAGVKGKNVQALARGLPLVTTTVGAEGMPLTQGEEALITDDAQAFAEGVLTLLTDDAAWLRMSEAGLAMARKNYDVSLLPALLDPLLREAVATRPAGSI